MCKYIVEENLSMKAMEWTVETRSHRRASEHDLGIQFVSVRLLIIVKRCLSGRLTKVKSVQKKRKNVLKIEAWIVTLPLNFEIV